MTNPTLIRPWMIAARVVLLLCVAPLLVAAKYCSSQCVLWSEFTLRPSDDGKLIFVRELSQARTREAYVVFDWDTHAFTAVERRDTPFVEPDEPIDRSGVALTRLQALMARDSKNGWSLIADSVQSFVQDDQTGAKLLVIDQAFANGCFIPIAKKLVYIDQRWRIHRVSLPSGTVEQVDDLLRAYARVAIPWFIVVVAWLVAWGLLWTIAGSWLRLDLAALSFSLLLLSSAYFLPLLEREHDSLVLQLAASLAVLAGLWAGSMAASWAIAIALTVGCGTTLALWTALATSDLAGWMNIALLLTVVFTAVATVFLRAAGRGVTRRPPPELYVRKPRPRASLLHFFWLTAACAYLLVVTQWLMATWGDWRYAPSYIPWITAPVCTGVGIAILSIGLLGRFGWIVLPIGVGLTFAPLNPPIWFIFFMCYWMYLLRCGGYRSVDLWRVA